MPTTLAKLRLAEARTGPVLIAGWRAVSPAGSPVMNRKACWRRRGFALARFGRPATTLKALRLSAGESARWAARHSGPRCYGWFIPSGVEGTYSNFFFYQVRSRRAARGGSVSMAMRPRLSLGGPLSLDLARGRAFDDRPPACGIGSLDHFLPPAGASALGRQLFRENRP